MPRHCSVPGCKSNYFSRLRVSDKISTFSFPSNEEMKARWVEAIQRKDWTPTKYSCVCILHFHENDIIRSVRNRPLQVPKIKQDAVPSQRFFAKRNRPINVQQHREQIKKLPFPKPEIFKPKIYNNNDAVPFVSIPLEDLIKDFSDFCTNFEKKLDLSSWYCSKFSQYVVFFKIKENDAVLCDFTVRLSISSNLLLRVILCESAVMNQNLLSVLPKDLKLTCWAELRQIMAKYNEIELEQSVIKVEKREIL